MAGSVAIQSEVGKGSTWFITFKTVCQVESGTTLIEFRKTPKKSDTELISKQRLEKIGSLIRERRHSARSVREASKKESLSLLKAPSLRKNNTERSGQLKKPPVSKPNLLVANDNNFILSVLFASLEEKFNLDVAENGLEAFDWVRRKGPNFYHAIILDINMPIMDGVEACNKIHAYIHGEDLIKNMSLMMSDKSLSEDLELNEPGRLAKIYALTADVSEQKRKDIMSRAPHFEDIFDMLSAEVIQVIADNAITPILSVSPMGSNDKLVNPAARIRKASNKKHELIELIPVISELSDSVPSVSSMHSSPSRRE